MSTEDRHAEPKRQKSSGGKKAKRRAVVRLSEVDRRRLESGEIADPYQAVGKPDPLNALDRDDEEPSMPRSRRDSWLQQNVPPHW